MSHPTQSFNIESVSGQLLFRRNHERFSVVIADVLPRESKEDLHGHDYAYFSFLLRGSSTECFDFGPERWNELGAAYFHPCHEVHTACIRSPSRLMALRLTTELSRELEREYGLESLSRSMRVSSAARWGSRVQAEAQTLDQASTLELDDLLYSMIDEVVGQPSHRAETASRWLNTVREMLHDAWQEPLDITMLAHAVNKHPSHLSRTFRSRYGLSPAHMLRAIRLEKARMWLANSTLPIVQIAMRCGFFDESHFARFFRSRYGVTPGQWRSRHHGRREDD